MNEAIFVAPVTRWETHGREVTEGTSMRLTVIVVCRWRTLAHLQASYPSCPAFSLHMKERLDALVEEVVVIIT